MPQDAARKRIGTTTSSLLTGCFGARNAKRSAFVPNENSELSMVERHELGFGAPLPLRASFTVIASKAFVADKRR